MSLQIWAITSTLTHTHTHVHMHASAGVGVLSDPAAVYHEMHTYLRDSGVDGVKVDCQVCVGSRRRGGACDCRCGREGGFERWVMYACTMHALELPVNLPCLQQQKFWPHLSPNS
eukprot:scaffold60111_cov23-Tisochrysis_lutea.AAC.1